MFYETRESSAEFIANVNQNRKTEFLYIPIHTLQSFLNLFKVCISFIRNA